MEKNGFFKRVYTKIEVQEFIEKYSAIYYEGGGKLDLGISQNSRFVEEKIEQLLQDGIKTKVDIIHILAWKIGKIKVKESESEKQFIYSEDWKNAESFKVKNRGREMDLTEFVNYVHNNIRDLEELAMHDQQETLNLLMAKSPKGIGTVYLITMLYFISKGKYPIYDQFAKIAVDAIQKGIEPEEYVEYKELPEKDNKKFKDVFRIYEETYVNKLKDIFGIEDYNKRDVDRALWVYGHYFKSN